MSNNTPEHDGLAAAPKPPEYGKPLLFPRARYRDPYEEIRAEREWRRQRVANIRNWFRAIGIVLVAALIVMLALAALTAH